MASLQPGYVPDDFASAVLADGRVVITGGEYNNGQFALTNLGAVYDPIANTWTPLAAPPGWDFIGDSPSVVLPDGRFVVGRKLDMQVAALDPTTLTWTLLGSIGKSDFNAEEGWTLLPDGTVFTFDVLNAPNSEIYNPSTQTWQTAGSTIVDLHSPSPFGCLPYGPNGAVLLLPARRSRSRNLIGRWPRILHRVQFSDWSGTYRDLYALNRYLGCRSRFSQR